MRSIVGWRAEGWFYLSTILDDFSRYIIAWKLCAAMKAEDATVTPPVELVQSLFDLTPAEARVARGLASGKTVEDIASDGGTSPNTLRTQPTASPG